MVEVANPRFAELVDDAIDALPLPLLKLLDNVVIQIEEVDATDEDLLGVYNGLALTERTHDYGFTLPDTITIYRRPILQMCDSEQQVAREIEITVIHEIGHHFGIDDARMHELGWG